MKEVLILTGAGQIGMAIARRMGHGMKIVVGDKNIENIRSEFAESVEGMEEYNVILLTGLRTTI